MLLPNQSLLYALKDYAIRRWRYFKICVSFHILVSDDVNFGKYYFLQTFSSNSKSCIRVLSIFMYNSFSLLGKLLFKFEILESSFSLLSLCFLITHGLCFWLWKWLFGYPLLYTLRHRSLTLSPAYNFLYVKSGNLKSGYVI